MLEEQEIRRMALELAVKSFDRHSSPATGDEILVRARRMTAFIATGKIIPRDDSVNGK